MKTCLLWIIVKNLRNCASKVGIFLILSTYRTSDRVELRSFWKREILIRIYRARVWIRLVEKNGPVGGLNQMKPSEKRVNFRLAVPTQCQPLARFIVIVYYIRCVQTKDRHVQYITNTGMCTYVQNVHCTFYNFVLTGTRSDPRPNLFVNEGRLRFDGSSRRRWE